MPNPWKPILVALTLSGFSAMPVTSQDLSYITAANALAVEDQLAVQQIIARLNHALDAEDYALYASYFAEDGVFASDFGNAVGPAEIESALLQSKPLIINRRHVAGNYVISGSGDDAVVTTYLVVFERVSGLEYVGSAINADTMRRIDGEWKITLHDSKLDPATMQYIQELMQKQ